MAGILTILLFTGYAMFVADAASFWPERPTYWWRFNYSTTAGECSPVPYCSRYEKPRSLAILFNTSYHYETLYKDSVTFHHKTALPQRNTVNDDVMSSLNITLYYESPCADCKEIYVNKTDPTYRELVATSKLNLRLVRFKDGRALEHGDKWLQQCQQGHAECLGNKVEACAIRYAPRKLRVPFIFCLEYYGPTLVNAQYCASMYKLPWKPIQNCINAPEFDELQNKMEEQRDGLNLPRILDPLFNLNGDHRGLSTNMLGFVCRYYGDARPAVCNLRNIRGVVFRASDILDKCY